MKTTKSTSSLLSRLLGYGFSAVAAILAHQASAELVVHDGGDFRSNTIFFDMESGTVAAGSFEGADFELWPGDVDYARIRGLGSLTTQGAVIIESEFSLPTTVQRLSEGDTVDESGLWGGYDDSSDPGAGWELSAAVEFSFGPGERGYLGLRFTNKSDVPVSYLYGWAEITYHHHEGPGLFTLHRWAIQTVAGQPVVAGFVMPTPTPGPSITLTSPKRKGKLPRNGRITIRGTASQGFYPLASYQYRLNKSGWKRGGALSGSHATWRKKVGKAKSGRNTIQVRSFDVAGQSSPAVVRRVTLRQ